MISFNMTIWDSSKNDVSTFQNIRGLPNILIALYYLEVLWHGEEGSLIWKISNGVKFNIPIDNRRNLKTTLFTIISQFVWIFFDRYFFQPFYKNAGNCKRKKFVDGRLENLIKLFQLVCDIIIKNYQWVIYLKQINFVIYLISIKNVSEKSIKGWNQILDHPALFSKSFFIEEWT